MVCDATLGGGGYTRAIAERVSKSGKVLAIDLDREAIEAFHGKQKLPNVQIVQGNFRDLYDLAQGQGIESFDCITADLGLSSFELDQSGRGFSFQKNEPLDMRFDSSSVLKASDLVNKENELELVRIFKEYGEEKLASRIAREIVQRRERAKFVTTEHLVEAIKATLPKPVQHKWNDTARRVFQALRIAVNGELDALEEFLPSAFSLLKSGGRLVVVSFHSLEDGLVKHYFQSLEKSCVCPPEFPVCVCEKKVQAKILTKKPVTASAKEISENPRSKPAKLRAIIKL